MRYLVTTLDQPPFLTKWYQFENHFVEGVGMIIYDLADKTFTKDGTTWEPIEFDRL